MKLTAEQLDEGRELLRAEDWTGFAAWMGSSNISLDPGMVIPTYQALGTDRAVESFDRFFIQLDVLSYKPEDVPLMAAKITLVIAMVVGAIAWLLRGCE